jgi:hypothetical protein
MMSLDEIGAENRALTEWLRTHEIDVRFWRMGQERLVLFGWQSRLHGRTALTARTLRDAIELAMARDPLPKERR